MIRSRFCGASQRLIRVHTDPDTASAISVIAIWTTVTKCGTAPIVHGGWHVKSSADG